VTGAWDIAGLAVIGAAALWALIRYLRRALSGATCGEGCPGCETGRRGKGGGGCPPPPDPL
jgi:hypothetical protein